MIYMFLVMSLLGRDRSIKENHESLASLKITPGAFGRAQVVVGIYLYTAEKKLLILALLLHLPFPRSLYILFVNILLMIT